MDLFAMDVMKKCHRIFPPHCKHEAHSSILNLSCEHSLSHRHATTPLQHLYHTRRLAADATACASALQPKLLEHWSDAEQPKMHLSQSTSSDRASTEQLPSWQSVTIDGEETMPGYPSQRPHQCTPSSANAVMRQSGQAS